MVTLTAQSANNEYALSMAKFRPDPGIGLADRWSGEVVKQDSQTPLARLARVEMADSLACSCGPAIVRSKSAAAARKNLSRVTHGSLHVFLLVFMSEDCARATACATLLRWLYEHRVADSVKPPQVAIGLFLREARWLDLQSRRSLA